MNNKIANRIKELRGNKTQPEFAKELGVSLRAYKYYEAGERSVPVEFIEKLSELCHVTADFILRGKEFIEQHNVLDTMDQLEKISEGDDFWSLPASVFLDKYEKKLVAAAGGSVAEQSESYGVDDATLKILDMLKGMDAEARRDVLKYAEKEKLLADLKRERLKKEAG